MIEYESLHDEHILLVAAVSLVDPDPDILDRVSPEDFADGNNGEIWSRAREVRNTGARVTPRAIKALRSGMPIERRLRDASEASRPTDAEVASAEQTVKDLGRRRRLQGALNASLERLQTSDSYSEALESAHAELARLQGTQTGAAVQWFSSLVEKWQAWNEEPSVARKVVPTPWSDLNDRIAGGLHAGRSYVVGGRPGGGKSILGANLALHAAEQGHTSVVFSVEMGDIEVTSRLLASGARASYGGISRREMLKPDFEKVAEYIDSNSTIPLAVVDKANVSVEYIAAICRSVKRSRGLDVVFVDYLQLLKESDSKAARERQVSHMSRSLKLLARELDCAVIIACQLNRNSANEKRAPTLADLRESGSIEQDCDVAILLHHQEGKEGDVELIVAKNRTGPPGVVTRGWASHQSRIA